MDDDIQDLQNLYDSEDQASLESHEHRKDFALETLKRYTGSDPDEFQPYILLTNFRRYVEHFAVSNALTCHEGEKFKLCHCPQKEVTLIDFKIGSPFAALCMDLLAFLPIKGVLFLGMCGGLRRRYKVGEYLVPVASIRMEGTSDNYFPKEMPALSNFHMVRAIIESFEKDQVPYHSGITFTTNIRFWEFDKGFREQLIASRAQGIEMECATLNTVAYKRRIPLASLILISDLPLLFSGLKRIKSSSKIYEENMADHIEKGLKALAIYKKFYFERVNRKKDRNSGKG
jgi:AMP nucleosidase